ncbi:hypothetical protein [Vibrio sp. CB1-14]|jgi:hypothetical protein|uniref:N-acetyltransferase domain-containing protein n=1 Tax=Vibrio chaetopteri TaxID=3016528 RepID=A0AAU8BPQ2_9VIBR
MNYKAQQLLQHLCSQYDQISTKYQSEPFPVFAETFESEYGHCLVRSPAGSHRFSIVSVNFVPSARGQGVLTQFIHYIKNNPYHYQGVEVEIIENQCLAKKLLSLGWEYKSVFNRWFCSKTPSLIKHF